MRFMIKFACLILSMVRFMKPCEEDGVEDGDVDLTRPAETDHNGQGQGGEDNQLLRSIHLRGPTDLNSIGDNTAAEQSGDSAYTASGESLLSCSELGAAGLPSTLTPDGETSFELGKFADNDDRNPVASSQNDTPKNRENRGQRPGRMLCPTCRHGRPPPTSTEFTPESVVAQCGRCQSYYDLNHANDAATAPTDGNSTDEQALSSTSGIV
ncbi:unnamed protein product [Lymnaea stagnalis]|uniref:GATA-type domain-containing protein n=1 Tax=Lymnaea stagnalis TaxID=6523 RepID=A0AAV2ITJ4_LYMST